MTATEVIEVLYANGTPTACTHLRAKRCVGGAYVVASEPDKGIRCDKCLPNRKVVAMERMADSPYIAKTVRGLPVMLPVLLVVEVAA